MALETPDFDAGAQLVVRVPQRESAESDIHLPSALLCGLREAAQRALPNEWCIVPFGSHVHSACLPFAPLDVALVRRGEPSLSAESDRDVLQTFASALILKTSSFVLMQNQGFSEASVIAGDSPLQLWAGDFSEGQWIPKQALHLYLGTLSTGIIDVLLGRCLRRDHRARAFVMLVKHWAQRSGFTKAASGGTFPWTLLATFYLQGQGFFPPLQDELSYNASPFPSSAPTHPNTPRRSLGDYNPNVVLVDFIIALLGYMGNPEPRPAMCIWTGTLLPPDAVADVKADIAACLATAALTNFEEMGAGAAAAAANNANEARKIAPTLASIELAAASALELLSVTEDPLKYTMFSTAHIADSVSPRSVSTARDHAESELSTPPRRRDTEQSIMPTIKEDTCHPNIESELSSGPGLPPVPTFPLEDSCWNSWAQEFELPSGPQLPPVPRFPLEEPQLEISANASSIIGTPQPVWMPAAFWMSWAPRKPFALSGPVAKKDSFWKWKVTKSWLAQRSGDAGLVEAVQLDPSLAGSLDRAAWARRLNRREHQIRVAKKTRAYLQWNTHFELHGRRQGDPQTPRAATQMSKRGFEKAYVQWRTHLHEPPPSS